MQFNQSWEGKLRRVWIKMMIIFLILKTKTKTKNRTTTWQKLSRGDPELSVTHTVILSRCRIISVKFSKGCLETHRPSPSTFIWLPLLQCLRERVQSCELQCPDTNTNISVLLYRWKKKALCHISASLLHRTIFTLQTEQRDTNVWKLWMRI